VLVPLPRLPLLVKLVVVLTPETEGEGEGGGDVRALPRLGLGPTDGSSFDDSRIMGNFFKGRRCTGRQGPHGVRSPRESVAAVLCGAARLSVST
jgi:hypothetical protein